MADNLVKFVYAASATAEQIAAFDSNTIYFVGASGAGAGGKLYKGPRLYDAGSEATAADLAALESYVGDIPSGATAEDIVGYIQEAAAAAEAAAKSYADNLDGALANVAHSGAAADVSIADANSKFTATNVEAALEELYDGIQTGGEGSVVTLESSSGSGDVLTTYDFYQGVLATDDAAAKAAKKIGTINIPKDYLVRSATIEQADTADEPYTGAEVGDKYIDFVINTKDGDTGTPVHIYIALDDLVAVMSGGTTSEITVSIDSHNQITATVNEIDGSKVIYEVGTGGAADITVNDKLAALEQAIGDGIDALDGSATIATKSGNVVTIKGGISEVNGVIDNDSSSDITLAAVAVTGSAQDVSYGASTAKAALDTIGTIPSTATATTVVGYVDEKVSDVVGTLNANVDAALGAGDTDPEAVAVVTGVTEANGIITSVDSAAADAAGAATRAKAAVIGQSGDGSAANTIYGAKAYAAEQLSAAINALDADKDAALGVADTDSNAVAVMSGVTQVNGLITTIDSVAVDAAGSATAAEAAAKAYAEQLLTWGALPAVNAGE